MLIVWDRLLGTFAAETTEPTYGVEDARLATSNPLRANVVGWLALVRRASAHPHRVRDHHAAGGLPP